MKKYVDNILRNKKKYIALLLVTNILAIIGILKIQFNTDFAIFSTKSTDHQELLDDTNEAFGTLSQIIILVEDDDFEDSDIRELRGIQNYLESVPNITSVQGIAPEEMKIGTETVKFTDLSTNQIQVVNQSLGDFSTLHKLENYYYQITIFLEDDFSREQVKDIESYLDSTEYNTYIAGDFYNQVKIIDYILFVIILLPPSALFLIVLVFKQQIGSLKATILSIVPAGLGALWTMGFIGLIGREVSILSAVVPIFVIVIGSADGLHFMSHIQDAKSEGQSIFEAIASTLKMVGIPMIVTTLTSMVGFLSLLSMNTSSVVDLAIYAAVGIFFAGVATWFVLPLILVNDLSKLDKLVSSKIDVSGLVKRLWGLPSILIVLIIGVVSVITIPKINNEFNMLMIYKDYTVVSENASKVEEVIGGSIPLYIVIESDSLTTDSMESVITLENKLMNSGYVNKVVNPYNLVNQFVASNGVTIQSDEQLVQLYNLLKNNETPISTLLKPDLVRLLVFPKNMENNTLTEIEGLVDDNTYVTGVQYLMKDLNVGIGQMQINSILIAMIAVFTMLLITIRSFKIALASLVPISITVLAVYGFLGLTGISLNITTTIIFSITIGVGIDYAVHFSSIFKEYLKVGDSKFAVEKAFKYTSRPVIANALGISIGLSILMFSPLNIHFNVSILMWVSMLVSVLVTLTILPLIFLRFKK